MEIGVNVNTDLPLSYIIEAARAAEASGYDSIWVGEAVEYPHPLPIIALICKETKRIKVGAGILSSKINRCLHIIKAFQTLQEAYGNRLVVGLAPGDYRRLEALGIPLVESLTELETWVEYLSKTQVPTHLVPESITSRTTVKSLCELTNMPIYVGASGPRMIRMASLNADGILLNYICPKFVEWALKFVENEECCIAAYGPALLKSDDDNLGRLRISAATVLAGANNGFLKEFGLEGESENVKRILAERRYIGLADYDELLLNRFSICSSIEGIEERIKQLKDLGVDQVILATPFWRNLSAIKTVGVVRQRFGSI